MLDIALLRAQPEEVKRRLAALCEPDTDTRVERILALDSERRRLLGEAESLQAARNRLNRALGPLRGNRALDDAEKARRFAGAALAVRAGDCGMALACLEGGQQRLPGLDGTDEAQPDETHQTAIPGLSDVHDAMQALVAALRDTGARHSAFLEKIRATESDLREEMLWLPNLPHSSVPVAEHERDNRPGTLQGELFEFDVPPRPHWELAPALGILDLGRGVKLSGSRGYVLLGAGARLQAALIEFFLARARARGFEQVYVPYMVSEEMLVGAGQLPKFRDTVYHDAAAGRYFLPTAEVALTNLHRDEILAERALPLNYVCHTPCFRRERMSAGRDTRGIKRVHQFEKVEMYKFVTPETSYSELESLTEAAGALCSELGLPWRRLEIVSGDLGFSASKKYDIEVYAPGCDEWLEVSSCSNTEAFQARRANIRFRREGQKRPQFLHTLNGSGLGMTRTIIAILENYQQADGSVRVPEALAPYMDGQRVISPRNALDESATPGAARA